MTAYLLPRPPALIQRHRAPVAPLIARIALSLVGSKNACYLPRNPRKACAAFVGAVLVRAGALPARLQSVSASRLTANLQRVGWVRAVGLVSVRSVLADRARPGDVLAFGPTRRGSIQHVGIAVGHGRFVGTSTRRGRVRVWTLDDWTSQGGVRIYRLPPMRRHP